MSAWSLMRVMAVGLGELGSVVAVENWPLRALSEEPSPALLMLPMWGGGQYWWISQALKNIRNGDFTVKSSGL